MIQAFEQRRDPHQADVIIPHHTMWVFITIVPRHSEGILVYYHGLSVCLRLVDPLQQMCLAFEAIPACLPLKGLLVTVVWNTFGIVADSAYGLNFVFVVFRGGSYVLDLIRWVVDLTLWLPLNKGRCALGHFLLLKWQ